MQCASPDAIARLPATRLKPFAMELWAAYFDHQKHSSLVEYLNYVLEVKERYEEREGVLAQVLT